MNGIISLARTLLLVVLPLAASCADSGEGASASDFAPVEHPPFEPSRAHELLLKQVSFGPRVPGTEGHRAQLEWMREYLGERADTVVEQSFTHTTTGGERLELTNLFARFNPAATERILLIAHWDTRPTADASPNPADRDRPILGANDGASGVAVLLELAELFRKQPPPVGVDILLVDGEDYGPGGDDMYLGARHFAANLDGYRPLYGVLLDMVGDRTPRFPVEDYSAHYAPEVVRRVWSLAEEMGYGDIFPNVSGGAIQDDHVPLNQAGIPTIDIIDFDYGPGNRYWHTHEDVPENTSAETLGIVGRVVAQLVYRGG